MVIWGLFVPNSTLLMVWEFFSLVVVLFRLSVCCVYIVRSWIALLTLTSLHLPKEQLYLEVNEIWQGTAVGKKRRKIWFAAPLCLFWNLWRARNLLVFENEAPSAQKIKVNFVSNLWSWANLHSGVHSHSVLDFLIWMGSR